MIPLLLATLLGCQAWATMSQPVPIPEDESTAPQIEIQGVGIGTFGGGRNSAHPKAETGLNFSDSAVFLGAAQKLYTGTGVGSFGMGGLTPDESLTGVGTQLFLHQAFVDFQSEKFEAVLGRTDNPTAHLVDFPTLRGDDLITLTNPLDPFSAGKNIEEHRYSNVAQVTFNQGLKTFESIHAQHLINSAGIGSETGTNSFGGTLERLGAPGMEAFESFPSLGLGYEHITSFKGAAGTSGPKTSSAGGATCTRWEMWRRRSKPTRTPSLSQSDTSTAHSDFRATKLRSLVDINPTSRFRVLEPQDTP